MVCGARKKKEANPYSDEQPFFWRQFVRLMIRQRSNLRRDLPQPNYDFFANGTRTLRCLSSLSCLSNRIAARELAQVGLVRGRATLSFAPIFQNALRINLADIDATIGAVSVPAIAR